MSIHSSTTENLSLVSVDDYLAGEELARTKHEYLNGQIYAMVGGRYNHNLIASNILGILHSQLQNSPCRALNSDTKIRIQQDDSTRFYYPDVSVLCGNDIREDLFQDRPSVIVEVLSRSTRRIDQGEKLTGYLSLESLTACILVEQDQPAAKIYRSTGNEFSCETITGLDSSISLPSIQATLNLAAVYANVKFSPEPEIP